MPPILAPPMRIQGAFTRTYTEAEVNDTLEPYATGGDVAVLRRYLVDHELLERTRSGSEYARVDSAS